MVTETHGVPPSAAPELLEMLEKWLSCSYYSCFIYFDKEQHLASTYSPSAISTAHETRQIIPCLNIQKLRNLKKTSEEKSSYFK